MGKFEELLQKQASNPNFLSGAIVAGAAKLMTDRTSAASRSIDKLNQSLKLISDEPLTRTQQLQQLESDGDVKKKMQTIEQQAQEYQALTQNIIDRKDKFSAVYDQALTELAMIGGEDAQRLGEILQQRKKEQLGKLNEQGAMPTKILKFRNLVLNSQFDDMKFEKMYDDIQYSNGVKTAAELVAEDPEFGLIKGGKVSTWDEAKLDDYTKRVDRIKKRVMQKGGKLPDGVIGDGFNLAMARYGKSFSFNEMNPYMKAQLGNLKQNKKRRVNELISSLTRDSQLRKILTPRIEGLIQKLERGAEITDDELNTGDGNRISLEKLKELHGIYGARGTYNDHLAELNMLRPDIFATDEKGQFTNFIDIPLKNGQGSFRVPKLPEVRGIDVPSSFTSYSDGRPYAFDSKLYDELILGQSRSLNELNTQDLPSGGVDPFQQELYEGLRTFPLTKGTAYITEDILRTFGDAFGIPMSPDTRSRILQLRVDEAKQKLEGQ